MSKGNPINSSFIYGVATANIRRVRYDGVIEDIVEGHETPNIRGVEIDLCEKHKLPEGVVCGSRVEKRGIYLCKNKEGCPLRK